MSWTRDSARIGRLFDPVDIASLVFFRIAFGLLMLWEIQRYFRYEWIANLFIEPTHLLKYYGFAWLHPWPGDGMYFHFVVLGIAAGCIAAGLFHRVASVLFFLGFTYIFLLDATLYLNHFYLLTLVSFLMIFLPAHEALSADVALGRTRRSDVAPAWTLWLLRFQIGVPYVFGGLAKLNADWLRGEPMRTWLATQTDFPILGRFFTEEWMIYAFSYGGLLLDLLVCPLLLWRPTRYIALLAAVAFHVSNSILFQIGVFPWFMIAGTLMFLPPDWPRRLIRIAGARRATARSTLRASSSSAKTWTIRLLAAWLVVQLVVPLRVHLYPGNPAWTRQGHRFSWRMKLMELRGRMTLWAVDPATNRRWWIDPNKYLARHQIYAAGTQADLLLQLCRIVLDDLRSQGKEGLELYAESHFSLNGRDPQPLYDSSVNLAVQQDSLRPLTWFVPLTQPFRYRGGSGEREAAEAG